jgi:hypothetical protein
MDFVIRTEGAWSQIKGRAEPLESTAGVAPLSPEERIQFSRQIGERREAWREACEAHYSDLVCISGRNAANIWLKAVAVANWPLCGNYQKCRT